MIKTWNMIIADLQSLFEHIDSFIKLFGILISQPFTMIKLGIVWHKFNSTVKIFMSLIYFSKGKESISPVE